MSDEQWFCKVVGVEVGPVTEADLAEMFACGQIDRTDAVRRGKTGLWRPYDETFSEQFDGEESVATAVEPTWFFRTLGEEFGPYTVEELQEFVAQGQLDRKDKVREGRTGPWSRAKQVPGLFPAKQEENRELLSDFSLLEDAEPEAEDTSEPVAPPVRKPVPKSRSSKSKSGARRRSSRSDPDEELAAELLGGPDEPPASRPAWQSPAAETPNETPAAAAPAAVVPDEPPVPVAATPPAPRYTPPPPPPRSYSSNSKSSGGGFSLPEIDWTGTPVKVVAGLAVALIGGYFLMNMGFMGSMAAGSVYDSTAVLHKQFNTLHTDPKAPAYEEFYKKFKAEQTGLLDKLGSPSPGSAAREVKNALLTLGSAVEAYHRPDMEEAERESYKSAANDAMDRLKQTFGR